MHETPNSVRGNSSPFSPVQISAPHPCKQANSSLLAPAGTSQLRARQTCTALGTSCSLIARITKCLSRRENDSLTSERQRTPRAAMLIVSQMDASFDPKSSGFHTNPFCSPMGEERASTGCTVLQSCPSLGFWGSICPRWGEGAEGMEGQSIATVWMGFSRVKSRKPARPRQAFCRDSMKTSV